MPEISLIVPIYNVENYLERALKSIENQNFKDFEVILVDDGSEDKSPEIAEKFCEKNSNFKLIKQKNKGPASARNAALEIALGKYIAFMDSDDFLEPEFLSTLYSLAIESNADITCCNFNIYYPSKDLKMFMPFNSKPGIYENPKALGKLILDVGIHYYVWNKIYKRELFEKNKIKFENMYFEDISTCPKLFYYSKKVAITQKALYNYTSRESSILHSINAEKVNDYIKSLGIIRNFLELNNDYKSYSSNFWIHAQLVRVVVYYYIVNLHIQASNFKDFNKNISSAMKSISYFMNPKFNPVPEENLNKIPYEVIQPEKNLK